MPQPTTLQAIRGAPMHPAQLDDAVLLLIDMQEEYRRGRLPLDGIDAAVAVAADLLDLARRRSVPVVHVLHRTAAGAPIFDPTSDGYSQMSEVLSKPAETIVTKGAPNAFANTDLQRELLAKGRKELIVAGFMTHMCVSTTVRAAADFGYRSTVVGNACATRDLPATMGGVISASHVHSATLAALADAFAIVVPDASVWR